MCHSVEMYMPAMTQRIAEHRIGQVDFVAAERSAMPKAALPRKKEANELPHRVQT